MVGGECVRPFRGCCRAGGGSPSFDSYLPLDNVTPGETGDYPVDNERSFGMAAASTTAHTVVTGEQVMAAARAQEEKKARSVWLHAWHDPVAGLKAFSPCVRLSDVSGDGDSKLLVACSDRKLKTYKGTSLLSENVLLAAVSSRPPARPPTARAARSARPMQRPLCVAHCARSSRRLPRVPHRSPSPSAPSTQT